MHGKVSRIHHAGKGVFARAALALQRDALPLARDRARELPGRARDHGLDRRRRDHGRAPPHARRRRRAVPSRIDPHGARPRAAPQFPHARTTPMFTAQEAINRLCDKREIFYDEMVDLMRQVMEGKVTPVQLSAILMGLHVKTESVSEIAAAAAVMREFSTKVDVGRARAPRRHLRHRRGQVAHVQHLDHGGVRRGGGGRAGGQARRARGLVAVGQRRRARGPGREPRAHARAGGAVDPRGRRGLHVRAQPPSRDEARGAGAQGARACARSSTSSGPLTNPGGRAQPGDGRVPPGPGRHPGARAQDARQPPRAHRPRRTTGSTRSRSPGPPTWPS